MQEGFAELNGSVNILRLAAQKMGVDDQRVVINKSSALEPLLIAVTLRETDDCALGIGIDHGVQKRIGSVDSGCQSAFIDAWRVRSEGFLSARRRRKVKAGIEGKLAAAATPRPNLASCRREIPWFVMLVLLSDKRSRLRIRAMGTRKLHRNGMLLNRSSKELNSKNHGPSHKLMNSFR